MNPASDCRLDRPTLGGYTLLAWIARGGSADVYAVAHPHLPRPLALKLAHRADTRNRAARFARELQILGRLDHPGFARAYDLGRTDDGRAWLVVDRVPGMAPADWAAALGQPNSHARLRAVAAMGAHLAAALAHLHDHRLVHGDVKPGNLRVARGGAPRLFDLGAALDLDAPVSWTAFGAGLGTSRYAPPEVIDRDLDAIGPAADLYALGATLRELIAGHGADLLAAARPTLDPLLAPRVKDRPASAAEVAAALTALAGPRPTLPPVAPPLTPFEEAIAGVRGLLLDAPPGRGALVSGPAGVGVDRVLARLAEDATLLGYEVVSFDRVGVAGIARLAGGRLERPTVALVSRLSALDKGARAALEEALIAAAGAWNPLLLLAGRETPVVAPGPWLLSRRLHLLPAPLAVDEADYAEAFGDPPRGRQRLLAFGARWLAAVGLEAQPALSPPSEGPGVGRPPGDGPPDPRAALLAALRALAWPTPGAALAAALGLPPADYMAAADALVAAGLAVEGADGLRAVGALEARPLPGVAWARGDTWVGGEARAAWLVASGRLDDAACELLVRVPRPDRDGGPDGAPDLLMALAPALAAAAPALAEQVRALAAAWRDALAPAHLGGADLGDLWALRDAGRLSEARARAEATLARSRRPAVRVAAAQVLARVAEDLGTPARADAWRDVVRDEAAALGLTPPTPPPASPGPMVALDAALAVGDAVAAMEHATVVAARVDRHDRRLLWIRPELVALQVGRRHGRA